MKWHAWIVTTKAIGRADVETLIANWPHSPRAGAEWWLPIDHDMNAAPSNSPVRLMAHRSAPRPDDRPLPLLVVTFHGPNYVEGMPAHWITEMQQALSRPMRRAQLRSFISMRYYDRADLGLPEASKEITDKEWDAAWFMVTRLAWMAVEGNGWPGVLCEPYTDGSHLDIIRPADT